MTTETEGSYNGSTAILEELGVLLQEDTIPVNAAIRVMLKAEQHQIRVTHENKIAAEKRMNTIDADVKSKLSSRHAYLFGVVVFGLDRSGAIDLVLSWVQVGGVLFLKLFGI